MTALTFFFSDVEDSSGLAERLGAEFAAVLSTTRELQRQAVAGAGGREVDARGEGRLAMTGALLALAARGPSRIRGAEVISARFPRFVGTLRALGANIDVVN